MVEEFLLEFRAGPASNDGSKLAWGELLPVLLSESLLERFDSLLIEALEDFENCLCFHSVDVLFLELRCAQRTNKLFPLGAGVAINIFFWLSSSESWLLNLFLFRRLIKLIKEVKEGKSLGFCLVEKSSVLVDPVFDVDHKFI